MADIHLEDVTKGFERSGQQVIALESVSFTIADGEFVAIMGDSGSGKTTLLEVIGGLTQASSGKVKVGGHDLNQLSEAALARYRLATVGHVFQLYNLISSLTAVENVALPLLLSGTSRNKAVLKASELLTELDLSNRLDHLPEELSGGELQRVSMARALSVNPPILLADEPTGQLDSYTAENLMTLLLKVRADKTILMVTHNSRIAAYADRILRLKAGKLQVISEETSVPASVN